MDLLISYAVVLLPLWPIPFSIGGRKILGILCCGQNSNNRLPVLHLASYDPDDQGRARSDHESPYNLSDLPLILYKPIDQFWFLYALFILLVAISALLKLGVRPWAVFILAILLYPGPFPIASPGWPPEIDTRMWQSTSLWGNHWM